MKRVALVVGINRYPDLLDTNDNPRNLKQAASEADRVADLLRDYGDFEVYRFPAVAGRQQVDPLGQVAKKELGEALLRLFVPKGGPTPETALFYFAGHGWQHQGNGQSEGFLMTSDSCPELEDWGLSLQWLRKVLEASKVRQQLVWLDCCHSGELFNFADTDLVSFFERKQDRCLIAASREFEEAIGGVLTPKLLEGLHPDNSPDGWVTSVGLTNFLETALKDAPQHPIIRNPGGEILLTSKQGVKGDVCPYKGLSYFDFNQDDPQYFYGRTKLTQELLDKVRSNSFVAVLGMSGSGKSSVVRAGLLHQLQQDALENWKIIAPFTPGENPLTSFKAATGVELKQLASFAKVVASTSAAARVILVIDQLEEIFTLCLEDSERQVFFNGLLRAASQLQGKLCIVAIMRADFFGKLTEKSYGGIAKIVEKNLVTVLPMTEEELREAIVKPATKVGVEIDRELVTQMVADVVGSPGSLPLMQYALTQLWEEKTLNRLMLADYTRLGGVRKALEKHADGVYDSLSGVEQQIAQRIFLELTRLGDGTEDTRRQVRQQDLMGVTQSPKTVEQVIQKLADAKLIVTGEEEIEGQRVAVVNIAHEALIRNWGRLGEWLQSNRAALLRKQEIEDAAREWRDRGKGKDNNYLLQGTRLAAAEDYQNRYEKAVPLSSLAQEFVRRSVKHRRNRRRTLVAAISGVILGLTGLAGWALVNGADAQIRADSSSSESLYASDRKLEALVSAIRAAKRMQSPLGKIGARSDTEIQAITALREAVYGIQEVNRLEGHDGPVLDVDMSSDKELIVSAGQDGTVRIWDRTGREISAVREELIEDPGGSIWETVESVSFSPDGKLIAFPDGQDIQIVNRQGEFIREIKYCAEDPPLAYLGISTTRFSPDGQTIVHGGYDQKLCVHTIEGNLISILNHSNKEDNNINDVAFGAHTSEIIATATLGGVIRFWNYDGRLLNTIRHFDSDEIDYDKEIFLETISISSEGNFIASAGGDGIVKIWSNGGRLLSSINAHSGKVLSANLNDQGDTLVTSGSDNLVKLWTVDGRLIKTIEGHTAPVHQAKFVQDSNRIITSSDDGSIRIFELSPSLLEVLEKHESSITNLEFSPDGKDLISVSEDGYIKVLDLKNGSDLILEALGPNYGGVTASFSPDGKSIISTDGKIKIWSRSGELLKTIDNYFEIESESVAEARFNPKERQIVSAGWLSLGVRNLQGRPIVQMQDDLDVSFENLSISHDGKLVAAYKTPNTRVYSEAATLKVWQSQNGQQVFKLSGNKATFSYDNTEIATGGVEGIIRLYTSTGQLIRTINGHSGAINDIEFSSNNRIIASSSDDKTVRIWSRDGTLIDTLEHEEGVTALSFSPDSKTLAAAQSDGKVILWNLDLDDLLVRGCSKIRDYLNNNPNVAPSDKKLCNGVPEPSN